MDPFSVGENYLVVCASNFAILRIGKTQSKKKKALSDEDAALEEEQEALRLQRQAAQALQAADFDQARGQHSLLCALLSPFGVHRLTQPNLSP